MTRDKTVQKKINRAVKVYKEKLEEVFGEGHKLIPKELKYFRDTLNDLTAHGLGDKTIWRVISGMPGHDGLAKLRINKLRQTYGKTNN